MLPNKSTSKKRKRVKVVDGESLGKKPLGIQEFPTLQPSQQELDLEEAVFGFTPLARETATTQSTLPQENKQLAELADDQVSHIAQISDSC
jgi:hypothetical protein